jgi:hypothetical protein
VSRITVLTYFDRISVFYTLKPLLFYRDAGIFDFTQSTEYCLKKDKNKILLIIRMFKKEDTPDIDFLKKARDKYERIALFNDEAGAGIPRFQVLPYVDLLFKKSIYRDRSLYTRKLYGKQHVTQYYHDKYGIDDENIKIREPAPDIKALDKMRISWNVGCGDYPRDPLRQKAGVLLARTQGYRVSKPFFINMKKRTAKRPQNKGTYDIHSRFGVSNQPTIAAQRKLILEKISGNPHFMTGWVSSKQYKKEVLDSKIVLSPFGWGELCFRDFEAILSGSLLLKPDMSHLETWPDIFLPEKTYVPFSWDAEDLIEKGDHYLTSPKRINIVENASEKYKQDITSIDDRIDGILDEIEN